VLITTTSYTERKSKKFENEQRAKKIFKCEYFVRNIYI